MSVTAIGSRLLLRIMRQEQVGEWRFFVATLCMLFIITTLPYAYAYFTSPSDKQFMGIILNVPDHAQYFSWMRELTDAPLSSNKLTPEMNEPIFFNLLWWGMGRLSRVLGVGYAETIQLLRLVSGTLFLLAVYLFCGRFFTEPLKRRTAFLVITLGSGFGWVLIVIKYLFQMPEAPLPLLIYVAEANTFLSLLAYPHFVSAALYVVVFDLALRGHKTERLRYSLLAGLLALFLGWQHAYDLLLMYSILAVYAALVAARDRQIPTYLVKCGIIIGLMSWWPALYSVWLTTADPLWSNILAQFANANVYTPSPLFLPILLGPAFLVAVYNVTKERASLRLSKDNNKLFLTAWFLTHFVVIYIPTDYQIHMLNGWQIPIGILATHGLFNHVLPATRRLMDRKHVAVSQQSLRIWCAILFIAVVLPTNVYLWAWRFVDLARHDYPYYLHMEEVDALAWLESAAAPDDVIVSSLTIGQYIPAEVGAHAFLAHWAQTVNFFDKRHMVVQIYSAHTPDSHRQEILQRFDVDYIFVGPAERALGEFVPSTVAYLERVYHSPLVEIYQVRQP